MFVAQDNCEVAYSHISVHGRELSHKRYLSVPGKEFQKAANLFGVSRARYFQRVLRSDGCVGYAHRMNECGIFTDRWIFEDINILRAAFANNPETLADLEQRIADI